MNTITPAEVWSGMLIAIGAIALIAVGFLAHWHKINQDILREEKANLREWAHRYAEQLAQEYIRHIHIDVPVALVNESDIDWGDRKDDAV